MNNPPDREVAVFNAALQLPAGQRAAYLDAACAGENALRLKIEALLRVHDEVGTFLENPTQEAGPSAAEKPGPSGTIRISAPPIEKTGERIGRYKLLQQIGEGGCGVVYMAEQEEPVRRKVALKVIKLGMDTKHVIARFEAERQALALMDHPNIAKVLDAGATDTGRPFFVMELVWGIKITDYCDQNHLDTEARLKLFTQVCQAVQHAHQKGIIHRDIKPSNILVADHDGVPVPKVIDFGIAKATTDQRLTDKTLFTALEQFIGTPAYMSPEQARLSGLDIDTRTDIYSLGVLLYELLTGKTPFDAKDLLAAGLEEMRRTIREKEPQRPSTALSTMLAADLTTVARHRQSEAPKLVHLVRGDLDWIVMKALEKDRSRRYETANGLAVDVQRHLENEPVAARPPSNVYRFQKMVRRNQLAFFATSAVAAALVTGLAVSTWLFFKEKEARLLAVAARQEAEVARGHETILRQQAQAGAKIVQAKLLYDGGNLDGAEKLLNQIPAALIQPDPMHADLRRGLGCWHALHNRWSEAASNFKILGRVDQLDGGNEITLDYLLYGPALVELGDQAGYEEFCRAATSRFINTDNPVFAERVCKICLLLPGDKALMEQLGILYNVAAHDPNDPMVASGRKSWTCMTLGIVDYRRGNYPKAIEWCRQSLSFTNQVFIRNSIAQTILAMSYHQLKRDAEARATLAQAQASFEASDLGGIFWKGPTDWPQCRILLREADALLEGNSNAVTQVNAMAQSQYSLGLMYLNGDGVSQDWAQAVVSFRNAAEQGHAGAQYSLGWMYANGKGTAMDSAEALKWFRKSADQGYASAQYALGCIYANGDGVTIDPVEAAKWFRKAADPAQTLRINFSLPRP